ncbi:uncharacterized protein IL334_006101 [Kwoniella shivajii]|uniref:THO complex subunit 7 n=1 Tax=Kwoniella shivajii TaxID=564305 RepID=A0ABZ1D8Z7_9TREE|nr:hypothetical protein IL334_006101 [Kwoniella shivajii]
MSSAPFKEDALNRFRITHSDRDLKPLIRRLHRLPLLSASQGDGDPESEPEKDLVRMELLKWRAGIERVLGSISNLERQTEAYKRQSQETVSRTEQLRNALAREKEELGKKRKLREHQVKCDEVAKRINARGKTRAELDEQISSLSTSLEDHQASHALYLQTTQARLDTFSQITRLIEECRSLKLPIDPSSSMEEVSVEKMEVDKPIEAINPNPNGSGSKLNLSALEFQPTPTISTIPPPFSGPTTNKSAQGNRSSAPPQSSQNTLKPPSSGHLLPSRPNANRSPSGSAPNSSPSPNSASVPPIRQGSTGLPNRPSALRSSTTPALHGTGSLEDGEVGPEEGEVTPEDSRKRARGNDSANSRNTRSRAK